MERIAKNRFQQELFEKKAFLVLVHKIYLEAFATLKRAELIVIIDGTDHKVASVLARLIF